MAVANRLLSVLTAICRCCSVSVTKYSERRQSAPCREKEAFPGHCLPKVVCHVGYLAVAVII